MRPEEEKSRRGRRIPITPDLARLLRFLRGKGRPPTARVLLRDCGRPWTSRACSDRMRSLRERLEKVKEKDLPYAKRSGLVFYDLRAAAITRLLASGMAPPLVQKIAGHAHLTTTMRYCGNLEAEQRAAAEKMAAALGG